MKGITYSSFMTIVLPHWITCTVGKEPSNCQTNVDM